MLDNKKTTGKRMPQLIFATIVVIVVIFFMLGQQADEAGKNRAERDNMRDAMQIEQPITRN